MKKFIFFLLFFILVGIITLTVFEAKKIQDVRSQAAVAPASLSFSPSTFTQVSAAPFPVQVILNPAGSIITGVDIEIKYDQTTLTAVSFQPTTQFNGILINTIDDTTGTIRFAAVDTSTNQITGGPLVLGTIQFLGRVPGVTSIHFGFIQITALNEPDLLPVNLGSGTYTVTTPVTLTPAPTRSSPTLTVTPLPTFVPVPTSTPVPNDTRLRVSLILAANHITGNKNPRHIQRMLNMQVIDKNNQIIVDTTTNNLIYNSLTNTFDGLLDLGPSFQTGIYLVKIKTNKYLRKIYPGIQTITAGIENILPPIALVPGDINGDNKIDVLDFNILLDCGAFSATGNSSMANATSRFNSSTCQSHTGKDDVDLDDDGNVDLSDANYFLRSLATQQGN